MSKLEPEQRPSAQFEVADARDKTRMWKLSLFADALGVESPEGDTRRISRAELPKAIDSDSLFTLGILALNGERKTFLRLPEPTRDAVVAWIGPPTRVDLVAALRRRYNATSLIVGVLLVFSATPWLIARPVDWPIIVWGASMLAIWGLVRAIPNRIWFVIDAVIHTAVAAWFIYGITTGERHVAWAALLLLAFLSFNFSMKQYRRFARVAPDETSR